MSPQPINAMLKPHVQTIVAAAEAEATVRMTKLKESLVSQDYLTQCKRVQGELANVERTIEASDYPFYIKNHSSNDWLLTQFANRCLLLNIDESAALKEAVFLGAYRHELWELEREFKASVPAYTYDNFISGVYDPYFMELDHFYNVTEDDYYRIKEWQTETLRKVVQHDYELMVHTLQRHCQTLADPTSFLETQNHEIDDLVVNYRGTTDQLLSNLTKLITLSGTGLSHLDKALLQRSHDHFVSGVTQLNLAMVHPRSFSPSLRSIASDARQLAPNEASIFYSLNKVQDWIERVQEGQPLYESVMDANWGELLQEIETAANSALEQEEAALYDYLEATDDPIPTIKKHLFDRFEHYRSQFNALEEKYFFHLFAKERKHLLRNTFITNAFFSNDLPGTSSTVQKALTIHECLWAIVGIYGNEFNTHKMDLPYGHASGHLEILSLLNHMVMDKASYQVIEQSMDDFGMHFEQYLLPFELHIQNSIEVWRRQFFAGLDRLQEILDQADPSHKTIYLQSQIKELRHQELRLREYTMESVGDSESSYLQLFREFLRIEADYIRETRHLPELIAVALLPNQQLVKGSPTSLQDVVTIQQKTFILQLFEDLGVTCQGISIISSRKKGALRGIVEALREYNILPPNSLELLCQLLANEIQLELKGKLDYSAVMAEFKKKAAKYIAANYVK